MRSVTKYKQGGRTGNPFAMTKKEEDKSAAAVLKGDKDFMKGAKRAERKTDKTIKRTGGGAEGLAKLQDRLRKKAKRKREKEARRRKRANKRANRTLNPFKALKSRGRNNDSTGGQGKNAGCQGAGCGAYE
tara:strand:- start:429 stop:821 length:393 start_codon:yes stop_codon:yes gene_type:complete